MLFALSLTWFFMFPGFATIRDKLCATEAGKQFYFRIWCFGPICGLKRLTRNPRVLFLERGRLNVVRPGWKLLGSNLFTSILFSIWIGKSLLCMQPWICLGLTKHSTPYPSVWHFIFNYSKFHPCVSLIEKTVAKLRICESIFQQAIYVLDMSTFEPFSQ